MFNYIVHDNFLDDPNYAIDLSNKIEYHTNPRPEENWSGSRSTEQLHQFDQKFVSSIFSKLLKSTFGDRLKYYYSANSFFHKLPSGSWKVNNWWHTDPSIYAGVIYLNLNPPQDTGTILNINESQKVFDNKFNRLIMYRSDIPHRAQGGFGEVDLECRLTITFFIKELRMMVT